MPLAAAGDETTHAEATGILALLHLTEHRLHCACPIQASSGKTTRYRLNRGGSRRANAALYRVIIVRMRGHQPTLDYVRRLRAPVGCREGGVAESWDAILPGPLQGHLLTFPYVLRRKMSGVSASQDLVAGDGVYRFYSLQ
jgi:hypothetical protein